MVLSVQNACNDPGDTDNVITHPYGNRKEGRAPRLSPARVVCRGVVLRNTTDLQSSLYPRTPSQLRSRYPLQQSGPRVFSDGRHSEREKPTATLCNNCEEPFRFPLLPLTRVSETPPAYSEQPLIRRIKSRMKHPRTRSFIHSLRSFFVKIVFYDLVKHAQNQPLTTVSYLSKAAAFGN
jgi:hypothetical protein